MSLTSLARFGVAMLLVTVPVFHISPGAPAIASAQGSGGCVGDCASDGEVTIDDLLIMVGIALGTGQLSACLAGNFNGDEEITIDEILVAVANALTGCEVSVTPSATVPLATATPTFTAVPADPTATPTATPLPTQPMPLNQARPLAARVAFSVKAMSIAPVVVSAVANGISFGAALTTDGTSGGGAGMCPSGGTATRTGSLTSFDLSVQLSQCKVPTMDGSVEFNGSAAVSGSVFAIAFNGNITAVFTDTGGMQTLTAQAILNGRVSGIPQIGGSCQLQSLTLLVTSGSLSASVPQGGTSGVNFQNTAVTLANIIYDSSCVPQMYSLTFNGTGALLTPGGSPEIVTFNQLKVDVDESGADTLLDLSGGLTSSCVGGMVTMTSQPPLRVRRDEHCPIDGIIDVTAPQGMAQIRYLSDMSVEIDLDADGTPDLTAPNCLDPRLLMCLA